MSSADARRIVRDLGADDAVAKAVADAPELTNVQRDTLHAILSANAVEADLAKRKKKR
jgi:hypothetical protein